MDSETAPTRPTEAMRARETEKVFIVIVKGVDWLTMGILHTKKKAIKLQRPKKRRMETTKNWLEDES